MKQFEIEAPDVVLKATTAAFADVIVLVEFTLTNPTFFIVPPKFMNIAETRSASGSLGVDPRVRFLITNPCPSNTPVYDDITVRAPIPLQSISSVRRTFLSLFEATRKKAKRSSASDISTVSTSPSFKNSTETSVSSGSSVSEGVTEESSVSDGVPSGISVPVDVSESSGTVVVISVLSESDDSESVLSVSDDGVVSVLSESDGVVSSDGSDVSSEEAVVSSVSVSSGVSSCVCSERDVSSIAKITAG